MVNSTIIEYHNYKFMITDSPDKHTVHNYLEEYQKHNASIIVRLCESYYDTSIFDKAGIDILDLSYEDGSVPTLSIINRWYDIVSKYKNSTIAVHCLSGLGRAPLLVCLSLIENGMDKIEAIEMVRKHRSGALNSKQLSFIIDYEKSSSIQKWLSCLFQ